MLDECKNVKYEKLAVVLVGEGRLIYKYHIQQRGRRSGGLRGWGGMSVRAIWYKPFVYIFLTSQFQKKKKMSQALQG